MLYQKNCATNAGCWYTPKPATIKIRRNFQMRKYSNCVGKKGWRKIPFLTSLVVGIDVPYDAPCTDMDQTVHFSNPNHRLHDPSPFACPPMPVTISPPTTHFLKGCRRNILELEDVHVLLCCHLLRPLPPPPSPATTAGMSTFFTSFLVFFLSV
jgi:hypothetical protein